MAIIKGDKVTAADYSAKVLTLGYVNRGQATVSGGFNFGAKDSDTGYFWCRGNYADGIKIYSQGGINYRSYKIWRVTFDGAGEPVETLLHSASNVTIDSPLYFPCEPGYYKYFLEIDFPLNTTPTTRNRLRVDVKPYQTGIEVTEVLAPQTVTNLDPDGTYSVNTEASTLAYLNVSNTSEDATVTFSITRDAGSEVLTNISLDPPVGASQFLFNIPSGPHTLALGVEDVDPGVVCTGVLQVKHHPKIRVYTSDYSDFEAPAEVGKGGIPVALAESGKLGAEPIPGGKYGEPS